MVEVFKTNVTSPLAACLVRAHIMQSCPEYQVTFDLEDCDRILRIVTHQEKVNPELVCGLVASMGFSATPLEDVVCESSWIHLLASNH